ncbi:hypothetical protein GCM10018952_41540 [Streptosporangium vulgare]
MGVRVRTASRDGGLDAEPLAEPARLTEEWDTPTPVTREPLEHPAGELTAADPARPGAPSRRHRLRLRRGFPRHGLGTRTPPAYRAHLTHPIIPSTGPEAA